MTGNLNKYYLSYLTTILHSVFIYFHCCNYRCDVYRPNWPIVRSLCHQLLERFRPQSYKLTSPTCTCTPSSLGARVFFVCTNAIIVDVADLRRTFKNVGRSYTRGVSWHILSLFSVRHVMRYASTGDKQLAFGNVLPTWCTGCVATVKLQLLPLLQPMMMMMMNVIMINRRRFAYIHSQDRRPLSCTPLHHQICVTYCMIQKWSPDRK